MRKVRASESFRREDKTKKIDKSKEIARDLGVDILPKFLENPVMMKKILQSGLGSLMNYGDIDYAAGALYLMDELGKCAQIMSFLVTEENKRFAAFRLNEIINDMQQPEEVDTIKVKKRNV